MRKHYIIWQLLFTILLGIGLPLLSNNHLIQDAFHVHAEQQGKEFVIHTQDEFEALVSQAHTDWENQINSQWNESEILASELGSHPIIILHTDVILSDALTYNRFSIPLDVTSLTIQGNGHIFSGILNIDHSNTPNEKGIKHITLTDITIIPYSDQRDALYIGTNADCTIHIMGDVTIQGNVTMSSNIDENGNLATIHFNIQGNHSLTFANIGNDDAYDHTHFLVYAPLKIAIDGGSMNVHKNLTIHNLHPQNLFSSIDIVNDGSLIIGHPQVYQGFDIRGRIRINIANNSHFEAIGYGYGMMLFAEMEEYQQGDTLISVRDNSTFIVQADDKNESSGIHAQETLELHVDNSIALISGAIYGIDTSYNKLYEQNINAYTGTPSFFYVKGQENAISDANNMVNNLISMEGKAHGIISNNDDATPYYAVVSTPVLDSNNSHLNTITTDTPSVTLDITRLVNWHSTDVFLIYTFNNDNQPTKVPPTAITLQGNKATIDVSTFFTKAGTYTFHAYQEVEGYDSYFSNAVTFEVTDSLIDANPDDIETNPGDSSPENPKDNVESNGNKTDENLQTSDLDTHFYHFVSLLMSSLFLISLKLMKRK